MIKREFKDGAAVSQSQSRSVLVFDVGGSHISAAVCAESTYALTGISRAPLPADGLNVSPDSQAAPAFKFVRLIHALAERAAHSAGLTLAEIAGASLAMPGPFDYDNGISHMEHKLQSLKGVDLKAALATRFGWQADQFRFVNDAAAFTLGEAGAGSAKGHSRAVGITLGTGIGCAFAIDGKIAPSEPGNQEGVPPGGEIWNLPYNGKTVEDFVSTRYLRQHFQSLTGLQAEVSAVAAIADCQDNAPCVPLEELVARESQPRSFESTEGGATASRACPAYGDSGPHSWPCPSGRFQNSGVISDWRSISMPRLSGRT